MMGEPRATERTRAALKALTWADVAEREESAATDVIENGRTQQGWPGIAEAHRAKANRARKFAVMWARVAAVLDVDATE